MDLVRDDKDMVFPAEFPDAPEGLGVPDLPDGIMGIAENHEGSFGEGEFPLQVLEVHGVGNAVIA